MKKQFFALALALCLGLSVPTLAAGTEKTLTVTTGITVYLDGTRLVPTDVLGRVVDVFASEGTTYLPVRAISEALDLSVAWDADAWNVTITGTPSAVGGRTVPPAQTAPAETQTISTVGGITITLNGTPLVPTDVTGKVVDVFASEGTTYLPIRAVTTALGLGVEWDQGTQSVYLTSQTPGTPTTGAITIDMRSPTTPHRAPQEGDTIIRPDGTSVVLKRDSKTGVLGYGQNVGPYLGTQSKETGHLVEAGDWILTGISSGTWTDKSASGWYLQSPIMGQEYTYHWSAEWETIQQATSPNRLGTKGTQGQWDKSGLWMYDGGSWIWQGPDV